PVAWATPFTIQCPLAASAVESQNWYLAIVSPSASLTLNSDDARGLAPWATLVGSATTTTGALLTGATTWNSFQALQLMPSLARTHRSSVPEPDWNVVWPSCAAVTSIAMPVAWATPFTI